MKKINIIQFMPYFPLHKGGVETISEENISRKINFKFTNRREGDLAEFYCNADKAKKVLGWETKTSLDESLRNSWKFYNK